MGYSNNPALVRRAAETLRPLIERKSVVWSNIQHPSRFAYKIRECLSIARAHPAEFPELSQVAHRYLIRCFGGTVEARLVDEAANWANVAHTEIVTAVPASTRHVIDNPTSVLQVVNAWIHTRPSSLPYLLTNCSFSNAELQKLASWAEQQTPPWMVTHEEGTRQVTLALDNESNAEITVHG